MQEDAHINAMLAHCQADDQLRTRAWLLLDAYRGRGLKIASAKCTPQEKADLLTFSRNRLRAELCDLIQPLDLDRTGEYPTTSPATDPTQQTAPGA